MSPLAPGTVVDAAALAVPYDAVPLEKSISGVPMTRYVELDEDAGLGVWEHTPGVSRDVEADEVFVVLAGDARIEFTEPALPAIELRPGSIVRLEAGMHTIWTVRETLRKVYIAR